MKIASASTNNQFSLPATVAKFANKCKQVIDCYYIVFIFYLFYYIQCESKKKSTRFTNVNKQFALYEYSESIFFDSHLFPYLDFYAHK